MCLLGDKLYAVGGYDGQQYLNDVESYDAQNNEWTKVRYLIFDQRKGKHMIFVLRDKKSILIWLEGCKGGVNFHFMDAKTKTSFPYFGLPYYQISNELPLTVNKYKE